MSKRYDLLAICYNDDPDQIYCDQCYERIGFDPSEPEFEPDRVDPVRVSEEYLEEALHDRCCSCGRELGAILKAVGDTEFISKFGDQD